MFEVDESCEHGLVRVLSKHDVAGFLKPRFQVKGMERYAHNFFTIEELRDLRVLLNDHMEEFERFADHFSHP